MKIKSVKIINCSIRPILDSKCMPTLEVTLNCNDFVATASVPSGRSTGEKEATELRDADGYTVNEALSKFIQIIKPQLINQVFATPLEVDELLLSLDSTENKQVLGANTLLATSIASTKLFAKLNDQPVWQFISALNDFPPSRPDFYVNVIEGGVHANFDLPFKNIGSLSKVMI